LRPAPALALLVALSLGAIAALYARTLDYRLVWMDEHEIGEREIVLAPGEPWSAAFTRPLHRSEAGVAGANPYYRPLQILLVTAIHRVAGPLPRAYRLVSLALAVATCTAFGALALLLFGRSDLALLAAALAAVHPAGLESWVWISGIGEALSALFTIASVGFGLLCALQLGRRSLAFAALSAGAFVLALLAKEKGIAAPALLAAALVALRLARGAPPPAFSDAGPLRRGALLVALEGALALLYVLVWRPAMLGSGLLAAPLIGGSRATHLLSALASWPSALIWLAAPLHSSTSDAVRVVASAADPLAWLGLALAAGSLAACAWLLRIGRPVAALGLAWIWIAYVPSANLFPQIHPRAERYLFLSVFGAALLAVDLADLAFARAAPRWRRAGPVVLVGLFALALAQRSWARTPDWRSTRALFEVDVARDPDFREGRFHLASALYAEQRYALADEQIRELLRAESAPRASWDYLNEVGLRQLACANDLALHREADVVRDAEELARAHPALASTPGLRACLAQAQEALGRNEDARATYESVAAALPGDPPPAVALAMARVYAKLGRRDDAQRWLATARRDGPREPSFDFQLRQVERLLR
jgi:hypothetical protein